MKHNPTKTAVAQLAAKAAQPDCFVAVQSFDLMSSSRIKLLFMLRGIKKVPLKIGRLSETTDFILLEEDPGKGFVFGGIYHSRFVKGAGVRYFSNKTIRYPLKALWYWGFEAVSETETIITTVTAVKAVNWQMKRLFDTYWFFIKPFSGWIRRIILKKVKEEGKQPAHSLRLLFFHFNCDPFPDCPEMFSVLEQ